jgi:hypothetical protein
MVVGLPLLLILSLAKCVLIGEAIYSRPRSTTWVSVLRYWSLGAKASHPDTDEVTGARVQCAGDDRRKDPSIFGTRGCVLPSAFPLTLKHIPTSHRVEPRALGLSRGILALILCGILIGRGFTDLVVLGIREVGATTVKSVYVQSVNPFQNRHIPAPMWSIQVVRLWNVSRCWILF